jgi:hypothetical protein
MAATLLRAVKIGKALPFAADSNGYNHRKIAAYFRVSSEFPITAATLSRWPDSTREPTSPAGFAT